MRKWLAHKPYWDADGEIWMCNTCGRPSPHQAGLVRDKRGCRATRAVVYAPYDGEYAAGGHRLWVHGNRL